MNELLLLSGLDGLGQGQLTEAQRLRMLQDPRLPRVIREALVTGRTERERAPQRARQIEQASREQARAAELRRLQIEAQREALRRTPVQDPRIEEGRRRAEEYTYERRVRDAEARFNREARYKLPDMPATVLVMVERLAQAGVYGSIQSIPGFDSYASGRTSFLQLANRITADYNLYKARAEAGQEERRRLRRAIEDAPMTPPVVPGHAEPAGARAVRAQPRAVRGRPVPGLPPMAIPGEPPPIMMPPGALPVIEIPIAPQVRPAEIPRMPVPKSPRRAMEASDEYRRATEYVRVMYPKERGRTRLRQLREAAYQRIVAGDLKVDSRGHEIRPPAPRLPTTPTKARPTRRAPQRRWQSRMPRGWREKPLMMR